MHCYFTLLWYVCKSLVSFDCHFVEIIGFLFSKPYPCHNFFIIHWHKLSNDYFLCAKNRLTHLYMLSFVSLLFSRFMECLIHRYHFDFEFEFYRESTPIILRFSFLVSILNWFNDDRQNLKITTSLV